MSAMRVVIATLSAGLGVVPAMADMISPSHHCAKPLKPSHFATQADQSTYDRQLSTYRQCLTNFINEQNKEARMHSEAARSASNELKGVRT